MRLRICLIVFVLVCGIIVRGQDNLPHDTATVNKLILQSKGLVGTDSAKAINLAEQAKDLAHDLKYNDGEARAFKAVGMVYYIRGQYEQTLDYWTQSLDIFEAMKDDVGVANTLSNIGAIYLNQGADAKALEYSLRALQMAEKIGDTLRMITTLGNIGSIYHNKRDPKALEYLLKAVPLFKNNKPLAEYIGVTGNIGEVYFDANDNAKALEYYQKSISASIDSSTAPFSLNGIGKVYLREGRYSDALRYHNLALAIAKKSDDEFQVVRSLRGLADVSNKQGNIPLALNYYNQARTIAEKMDDVKVELKDLYKDMALTYSSNKDFQNAFRYQTEYADIKDTLYDIETRKKLNQLQFDFELSKKQNEIVLKEARIKSEKRIRLLITIGMGILLIFAFIIYRNYLAKARINKILDKQKAQIESLLLNILPREVASELQASGNSKPRHFEEASVLFTDFQGFTSIADKLSPEEVVTELNECFIAFDNIIESHGLEKIKTIGDAYMCAGNIPSPDADHAIKIVKAAMEIQGFVQDRNMRRIQNGLEPWEIRIGIHIGPLVAGVVGRKKYAYDIWGTTVNIASRMESNGLPGKVNISAATYKIIGERVPCTYRGKVYAKNLGELDMYLVNDEPLKADPIYSDTLMNANVER